MSRAASIAAVLRESEAPPVRAGAGAGAGAGASASASASVGADAGGGAARNGPPTPIRGRRRPQVLVGSAAAVLILAAAVGVPLALSGRSTSGRSTVSTAAEASRGAASSGAASSAQHHGRSALGTKDLSKFANAPIADLGPVGSVQALGARAAAVQPLNSAATPNAAAVPGAATAAPTEPGSSLGGTFAPLPTSAAIGVFERCFSSAVSAAGPGQAVQALATAEFEGTPALVFVFQPSAGGSTTGGSTTGNSARPLAVATARAGCRVLGTASI